MLYMLEPSPISAITLRSRCASAMPTAAGMPKPRPPLAMVKKVPGRVIGRYCCIHGRAVGASSTTMSVGRRKRASACSTYAVLSGSVAETSGGAGRGAGAWRGRCSRSCSRSSSARRMPPNTLRPSGTDAAASGSSVSTASRAPSGTCEPSVPRGTW